MEDEGSSAVSDVSRLRSEPTGEAFLNTLNSTQPPSSTPAPRRRPGTALDSTEDAGQWHGGDGSRDGSFAMARGSPRGTMQQSSVFPSGVSSTRGGTHPPPPPLAYTAPPPSSSALLSTMDSAANESGRTATMRSSPPLAESTNTQAPPADSARASPVLEKERIAGPPCQPRRPPSSPPFSSPSFSAQTQPAPAQHPSQPLSVGSPRSGTVSPVSVATTAVPGKAVNGNYPVGTFTPTTATTTTMMPGVGGSPVDRSPRSSYTQAYALQPPLEPCSPYVRSQPVSTVAFNEKYDNSTSGGGGAQVIVMSPASASTSLMAAVAPATAGGTGVGGASPSMRSQTVSPKTAPKEGGFSTVSGSGEHGVGTGGANDSVGYSRHASSSPLAAGDSVTSGPPRVCAPPSAVHATALPSSLSSAPDMAVDDSPPPVVMPLSFHARSASAREVSFALPLVATSVTNTNTGVSTPSSSAHALSARAYRPPRLDPTMTTAGGATAMGSGTAFGSASASGGGGPPSRFLTDSLPRSSEPSSPEHGHPPFLHDTTGSASYLNNTNNASTSQLFSMTATSERGATAGAGHSSPPPPQPQPPSSSSAFTVGGGARSGPYTVQVAHTTNSSGSGQTPRVGGGGTTPSARVSPRPANSPRPSLGSTAHMGASSSGNGFAGLSPHPQRSGSGSYTSLGGGGGGGGAVDVPPSCPQPLSFGGLGHSGVLPSSSVGGSETFNSARGLPNGSGLTSNANGSIPTGGTPNVNTALTPKSILRKSSSYSPRPGAGSSSSGLVLNTASNNVSGSSAASRESSPADRALASPFRTDFIRCGPVPSSQPAANGFACAASGQEGGTAAAAAGGGGSSTVLDSPSPPHPVHGGIPGRAGGDSGGDGSRQVATRLYMSGEVGGSGELVLHSGRVNGGDSGNGVTATASASVGGGGRERGEGDDADVAYLANSDQPPPDIRLAPAPKRVHLIV